MVAIALLASGAGACGGSGKRQDLDEPAQEFAVDVVAARFPSEQRLAQTSDLRLELENAGDEPVPDLAVTIRTGDSSSSGPFSVRSDQPGLADPNRPVWILENGYPKLVTSAADEKDLDAAPTAGADAAQTNTFSFGPLAPGQSRDIVWRLTPVVAGTYPVRYQLAGGLAGKAEAVAPDGGPVEGEFEVTITDEVPRASVNNAGDVVIDQP